MTKHDMELVQEYAAHQSEQAFAALVSRHINLIYSTALRQVRDPHQAEEVTQAVFILLARKAGSLGPKTILPAWLYRAACFAARDALRSERRRQHREQEAYMQSNLRESQSGPDWDELSPLLDDAMTQLRESDRAALVLRYFGNKSLQEVGVALGASEEATKKRVQRALEQLRKYFSRRGVASTSAGIAGTIAAHSVQAAPPALANAVTATAIGKGAVASASTLLLAKSAAKLLRWSELKAAINVGAGALLIVGAAAIIVFVARNESASSGTALVTPGDDVIVSNQTPAVAIQELPPATPRQPAPLITSAPRARAAQEIYPNAPKISDVIASARLKAGEAGGLVTIPPEDYVQVRFGNLFQKLNLTPDQIAAFTKIMVDRQDRTAAIMRQNPLDPKTLAGLSDAQAGAVHVQHQAELQTLLQPIEADADLQIKELLGTEDSYNYYRTYTLQEKERAVIMGGYREGLESAAVPPLTLDQVERLVALAYQNRVDAGYDPRLQADRLPQMLEQAGTFLTPDQVQVLTQYTAILTAPQGPAKGAIPGPIHR